MKDQKRLLHKCLLEDIPAFVICGTDICSVQTMEAYYQIAVEKGCNSNFLEDLKLAIEDFKAFQCELKYPIKSWKKAKNYKNYMDSCKHSFI